MAQTKYPLTFEQKNTLMTKYKSLTKQRIIPYIRPILNPQQIKEQRERVKNLKFPPLQKKNLASEL